MMTTTQEQILLSESALQTYRQAGVLHLPSVLSDAQLAAMRNVVDDEMANYDAKQFSFNGSDSSRFAGSQDMWRTNEICEDTCTKSVIPKIVSQILETTKVNLFFDHLFVKYPNSPYSTSWHNDVPYWPIKGTQILSCWIALDDVTDETGALVFALGSHKWGRFVQPDSFAHSSKSSTPEKLLAETVGDLPANIELKSFPVQAGDALFFDAMSVHCAGPNKTGATMRRGYAVRYAGDDVVYDPRPGIHKMMLEKELTRGGRIDCDRYPVVFQRD